MLACRRRRRLLARDHLLTRLTTFDFVFFASLSVRRARSFVFDTDDDAAAARGSPRLAIASPPPIDADDLPPLPVRTARGEASARSIDAAFFRVRSFACLSSLIRCMRGSRRKKNSISILKKLPSPVYSTNNAIVACLS